MTLMWQTIDGEKEYWRISYLDASVAVMLACHEPHSDKAWAYFRKEIPSVRMIEVCFYEALGVLKAKFEKKQLTTDQYFAGLYELIGFEKDKAISLVHVPVDELLLQAWKLVEKHHRRVDFSDALQILSVKHGPYSSAAGPSQTLLATADEKLAKAARTEGVLTWYVPGDPPPS